MSLTERIQSRKFLLAVLGATAMFLVRAYGEVAQIVIAYLAVQAAQDALSDWQQSRSTTVPPEAE